MPLVHVPGSTQVPGSTDAPGSGAAGATYTKAGRGVLVWNATGADTAGAFRRVRWIGDQYDTAALVTAHTLRADVTTHTLRAVVTAHQTRAVITTHRLRGEDA